MQMHIRFKAFLGFVRVFFCVFGVIQGVRRTHGQPTEEPRGNHGASVWVIAPVFFIFIYALWLSPLTPPPCLFIFSFQVANKHERVS